MILNLRCSCIIGHPCILLQAFEVWCEDSGGESGEAAKEDAFSALNRLLSALEETGTRVNVSTYPPVQYESDMMGTSSLSVRKSGC